MLLLMLLLMLVLTILIGVAYLRFPVEAVVLEVE